jgi:hypothetical protein
MEAQLVFPLRAVRSLTLLTVLGAAAIHGLAPLTTAVHAAADLVAAYHFNEGSGTRLTDVSGLGNHGTVTGAAWSAGGKHGGSLTFDGLDDVVTVPAAASLDLTSGMTLEAWVKPVAGSLSGWRTVVLKERPGGLAYALYGNQGVQRPGGEIAASATYDASGTAALSTTAWTHVAATYDGASLRFYVNGAERSARAASGNILVSNGALVIGGNSVWGEWFNGSIDEVRVYAGALTAAEIVTDMNTAIATSTDTVPPAVEVTGPANGSTVAGTVAVKADASDDGGVADVQFLLDGASLGAPDTTAPYELAWDTSTASNTSHTLAARARDAAGNVTTSSAVSVTVFNPDPVPPTAPGGLVAAYGFNEGSGALAADASGNGHTGTLAGAAWEAAGKYGGALSFNGTTAMVTVADAAGLDLTSAFTLEAWVKPDNAPLTDWRTILLKENGGGLAYALYANDAAQRPRVEISAGLSAPGGAGLPAAWTHVAGTYDGEMLRFHVNGVQASSVPSSATVAASSGALRIGGNSVWGEWFDGSIDEVRIYSRALTAAEIQADMHTPVAPDTEAPAVTITSPQDGSTVSRTVTLAAAAADNAGIAGVTFFVNGSPAGAEDTSAPYSAGWDTDALAPGAYSITASARDTGGNTSTSAPVTVSIVPDFAFTVLTPSRQVPTTGRTIFDIDVKYLNGFTSSSIDLWLSGVPAGVTGHYIFDPMAHQGRTSLIIDTNGVAPGTYTLTLGATGEGITHAVPATLVVTFGVDFQIGAAPSSQNINRGTTAPYNIAITETNDFVDPVALSVSGLPAGITASFSEPAAVPPASVLLNVAASSSAAPGTYTLTVTGTSGALVRSAPITLTLSSANATWSLATLGSTGELNNTVRVGGLRTDGLERVYVGTIQTGRVLEYTWNGGAWSQPEQVAVSDYGMEMHDMAIGAGRGDGKDRLYAASHDMRIYEIWHEDTGWRQRVVGVLDDMAMHTAVGDGRNDGVQRLYAVSTRSLYEFTWNGTGWNQLYLGPIPGAHGVVVGQARNNGRNYVYVASISSGTYEARFENGAWAVGNMGDSGDARNLYLGTGRNDGVVRVYSALLDGRVRELSWNGSGWSIAHLPDIAGAMHIHSYVLPGRNDGIDRVYTSSGDGKAYEYSWTGSAWQVYELGGGGEYMYGMHFGRGRNDGLLRLYGADRGTLNQVYEFTWK